MQALERVVVKDVTKRFGEVFALRGVDAEFNAGETVALQGANGSGKSTLLRMLAGFGRPNSGDVIYAAEDTRLRLSSLRAQLGYVGHSLQLYRELSGQENLAFFLKLRSKEIDQVYVESLIKKFSVEGFWDRPLRTYSRGQAQRAALICQLASQPKLLLLDEPETGLDRDSLLVLRELLEEQRERACIAVVVSHRPEFVSTFADRFLHLVDGKCVERD